MLLLFLLLPFRPFTLTATVSLARHRWRVAASHSSGQGGPVTPLSLRGFVGSLDLGASGGQTSDSQPGAAG